MTLDSETILIDSQPIPAHEGETRFTEKEVKAIVEGRQRLSASLYGTFENMIRELHSARITQEKENDTTTTTPTTV
jgi:hypothetical protein